jgi:hypothetical protein
MRIIKLSTSDGNTCDLCWTIAGDNAVCDVHWRQPPTEFDLREFDLKMNRLYPSAAIEHFDATGMTANMIETNKQRILAVLAGM